MKKNVYISPELITTADNQKAMIFFFFLKSKYRTSVFYHYTPERLSKITGLSVNTIRKYVGWLKSAGLLAKINGNLWLRATRKINPGKRLISVDSKPWTNWKQFENRVYAALIKWNIKQQTYHWKMKRLAGNPKSANDVRIARLYANRYKYTKESAALHPINSVRQLAKLFNRSQGWTQAMLLRLEKMGYIKRKQHVESLHTYIPPKYYTGYGYAFYNQTRKETCVHHGTLIFVKY